MIPRRCDSKPGRQLALDEAGHLSIPRRCDSKIHREGTALRPRLTFNTSKVRFEGFGAWWKTPCPRAFQYLEGAIRSRPGAPRRQARPLLSIPRRCDSKGFSTSGCYREVNFQYLEGAIRS